MGLLLLRRLQWPELRTKLKAKKHTKKLMQPLKGEDHKVDLGTDGKKLSGRI